jgi:hypothetical protein
MAIDHRMADEAGNRLEHTCQNRRFRTDIEQGFSRGVRGTRGSVFKKPLIDRDGYSLWLEHVEETETGNKYYWLMWYDQDGKPTIPLSGIFDKDELVEMAKNFASFVP